MQAAKRNTKNDEIGVIKPIKKANDKVKKNKIRIEKPKEGYNKLIDKDISVNLTKSIKPNTNLIIPSFINSFL